MHTSEALDEKERRELIKIAAKGIDKSGETVQKLLHKLISFSDIVKDKKIKKELEETDGGLLSSDSLEFLSSHIQSVESILQTINDVTTNLLLDQTSEKDSGEIVKVKHLINAMEHKVENIIYQNIKN